MASRTTTLLGQRALGNAASGVPVFPCVPGGKAPLTANGLHAATVDPDVIVRWWTQHPNANIAAATGRPAFDVLDVDVRENGSGWDAMHEARQAGLLNGWVRVVRTPSGGLHLYYPGTDQRCGSIRDRHLDFRGRGGYVLLPPSLGQTKAYSREYVLLDQRPTVGLPLNWAAITKLLAPPTVPAAEPSKPASPARADPTPWLAAHVAQQREGNRNSALYWATHRALEARVVDFEPLVAAAVSAGLSEKEARRTVGSARSAAEPSPTRLHRAPGLTRDQRAGVAR